MHCFGQVRQSDSGSSLLSARNTSVMIPNLSVNCEEQFSVRENQPGSNSVTLWQHAVRLLHPKSSAIHLIRFALRVVQNKEHCLFFTKFALDLFQCIALLQTFGIVVGLSFCCVSENAAFLSSNALFWSSQVERFWIKFAQCTKYFRYDPELISEL